MKFLVLCLMFIFISLVAQAQTTNQAPTSTNPTSATTVPPVASPAKETWVMPITGKTYTGVTILKLEPDQVSIMFDNGAATLDISTLSPEIQARLKYDPVAAAQAKADRISQQKAALAAQPPRQNLVMPSQAGAQDDTSSAANQPNPPVDKDALIRQIADLRADLAFQQRQLSQEHSSQSTHGTAQEKVIEDELQINCLSDQLKKATQ